MRSSPPPLAPRTPRDCNPLSLPPGSQCRNLHGVFSRVQGLFSGFDNSAPKPPYPLCTAALRSNRGSPLFFPCTAENIARADGILRAAFSRAFPGSVLPFRRNPVVPPHSLRKRTGPLHGSPSDPPPHRRNNAGRNTDTPSGVSFPSEPRRTGRNSVIRFRTFSRSFLSSRAARCLTRLTLPSIVAGEQVSRRRGSAIPLQTLLQPLPTPPLPLPMPLQPLPTLLLPLPTPLLPLPTPYAQRPALSPHAPTRPHAFRLR